MLIDYTALLHGGDARVAETADGQALPVEVIRRLCCDGTIVPIWLSGDLEVLAVGRQCRLATRAQRRALAGDVPDLLHARTAPSGSSTAGSITSRSGNTSAPPISTTSCRSANSTTTSSTKAAGPCELHTGRRITLHRPDGTISFDGVTTDRITAPTVDVGRRTRPAQPDPCRSRLRVDESDHHRQRPTRSPSDLQLALEDARANSP